MDIKKKWQEKKANWRFRNRGLTKAKILYYYLIGSGVVAFLYAISCIFTKLPYWYALFPFMWLVAFGLFQVLKKNWKLMYIYLHHVDRGRLLLSLSETHYRETHKLKLIKWVYPGRNMIRMERWLELTNMAKEGKELTDPQKAEIKRKKVVICPQQLQDGVNKAILVHHLIYAHHNIQFLDDEIRGLMKLTAENMHKFDLKTEINRCKTTEEKEKIAKYMEIGKKATKKMSKNG